MSTSPNFLIAGTSAAGTSFLANALVQHPDIYLPAEMRPEPHFFYKSQEYAQGEGYYQKRWFSAHNTESAIGERSSSYLFGGQKTASMIHKHLPNIRLIFTMRNPIERAWANYRFTALNGLDELSFDDALKNEKQRISEQQGIWAEIQPYNYTGRGLYADLLKQYLQYFPIEQMLILKSEDMSKSPQSSFDKVYEFLGVEAGFAPDMPPNHTSLNVINPALQAELRAYFKDKFDLIIESLRKEQDPYTHVSTQEEHNKLGLLVANLKSDKEDMSEFARNYLRDYYRDDIQALQPYISFSTEDWD